MSVAFYIVLDDESPGFETFVNGKAVAHCQELDRILKKLGLKSLDEYVDGDFDEFLEHEFDDFDEDEEEYFEEEREMDFSKYNWFSAAEGIEYFDKIKTYLQNNPADVDEAEDVISDLDEYLEVLQKAEAIGAKWHLQLDT